MKPFLYIAHPKSIDYFNILYRSLSSSRIAHERQLILPHSTDEYVDSKELFENGRCSTMVAEISKAATGVGAEIAFATVNGVDIVGVYSKGSKPSGTARRFCNHLLEYENEDELIAGLEKLLL